MKMLFASLMTGLLGLALSTGCAVQPDAPSGNPDGSTTNTNDNTDGQDANANGAGDNANADGDQPGVTGIVAQWDFDPSGTNGFASLAASFVADNVTASDFTSRDGPPATTTSTGVNWVTENGWTDGAMFMSCTIGAANGFEIRLDALNFEQSTLNETGPAAWLLRSSADGFTADLAGGAVSLFPNFGAHTVDLIGITIGPTPVEFRWFTTGATGENVAWGVEDVTFEGTVAPTG